MSQSQPTPEQPPQAPLTLDPLKSKQNGNGHNGANSNGNGHRTQIPFGLPLEYASNTNFAEAVHTPDQFSLNNAREFLEAHRKQARVFNAIVPREDIPSLSLDKSNNQLVTASFKREVSEITDEGEKTGVVDYPEVVVKAVTSGIQKYANAFNRLVQRERLVNNDPTAYMAGSYVDGTFLNLGLQIDMAALPHEFLEIADQLPREVLEQTILERVFEFENSLAMYNFMRGIFTDEDGYSHFKETFDGGLERLREATGKKVAIATLTDKKYTAIRRSELGLFDDEDIDEAETRARIGFDAVMSPNKVESHLARIASLKQNLQEAKKSGESQRIVHAEQMLKEADNTLFYVRSSLPVVKLADPSAHVDLPPIVQNAEYLRLLRERSLTPNVDLPDTRALPLNDTKEYMEELGIALTITGLEDIIAPESLDRAEHEFFHEKINRTLGLIDKAGNESYLRNKKYISDEPQEEVESLLEYMKGNGRELVSNLKQIRGRVKEGQTLQHAVEAIHAFAADNGNDITALLENAIKCIDLVEKVEHLSIADNVVKLFDAKRNQEEGTDPSQHLSQRFIDYLEHRGVAVENMTRMPLRVKPMTLSYGAYGHLTGAVNKPSFWRELLKNLDTRDVQVLQTEIFAMQVSDIGPVLRGEKEKADNYKCIDRLFFIYNFEEGRYEFLNGFRNHLPANHLEASNNDIHGNKDAHYTEIRQK